MIIYEDEQNEESMFSMANPSPNPPRATDCMCKLLLLSFISMLLIMEVLWIKHCFWTERPLFGEKPEFNVRGWWAIQSSSVDHWPAEIKTAFRRPLGDICSFRGLALVFGFEPATGRISFLMLKICWATIRSQIGSKSTRRALWTESLSSQSTHER